MCVCVCECPCVCPCVCVCVCPCVCLAFISDASPYTQPHSHTLAFQISLENPRRQDSGRVRRYEAKFALILPVGASPVAFFARQQLCVCVCVCVYARTNTYAKSRPWMMRFFYRKRTNSAAAIAIVATVAGAMRR